MATQPQHRAARGVALPYCRAWREYRLISIATLAKMAGLSTMTLYQAEVRGAVVQFKTLAKLAAALQISPEQLVRQMPPTE